jgi:recombination protein RecA
MSKLANLAAVVGEPEASPIVVEKKKELITKADKFAELELVAKTLNKQFDTKVSIVKLDGKVGIPMPSISTRIQSLDHEVIQCGGIPRGRVIEVYGPESSGKTTFCLHLIACEQQDSKDSVCAFVDAEHALDPTYAAKLGVNLKELLISQPDSGEQALETVEALVDSKAVSLIIVDSVAALVPQAELDGEMGDAVMGLQARLMSQAMRKLRGKCSANGVTVVFINQIREKIGVMFGSPEVTTGGRALKFYASVRLDVRKRTLIGEKEHPIGHELEIKAVKNKVGCPFRSTTVRLLYGYGIDTWVDFMDYAVRIGAVLKSSKGGYYSFGGNNFAQGLTDAIERVRVDTELRTAIEAKLRDIREEQNGKVGN